MSPLATIALFVGLVLATMLLGEALMRKLGVRLEVARKTFHVLAGSVCIGMTAYSESPMPLVIVGGIFALTLPVTIWSNMFRIQTRRRGYGTVAFALGYSAVVHYFWSEPTALLGALCVLTYGDGIAAVVGSLWGKHPFGGGRLTKSVEGSLTFAAVSFVSLCAAFFALSDASPASWIMTCAVAALLSTAVEAVSIGDIDNGVIPVYTASVLSLSTGQVAGDMEFAVGILLGAGVAGLSLWRRWVDALGAAMAFLILATMYGAGGWSWWVPILTLLVVSSLTSRLTRAAFENPFEPRRGPRGITQIAAKGAPAMVLALLFAHTGWEPLYVVCLALIATALSDTWASAFGGYAKADPIPSLPFFRSVPKGMSGGVTAMGFLASAAGAAAVGGFVFLFESPLGTPGFVVVVASGLVGSLADSVMGTTMQALYRCPSCGSETESPFHCGSEGVLIKGYGWVTNQAVNLLSGLVGGALALGWALLTQLP